MERVGQMVLERVQNASAAGGMTPPQQQCVEHVARQMYRRHGRAGHAKDGRGAWAHE